MSVFTRRAIAFLLALVLAIVAVVAILSYIRRVEQDVQAEAGLVAGYVATQQIEPGTLADVAIEQGAVEQREIPRNLLAENAVTDLSQVRGRLVQELVLPGDQLILDRFAAPGEGLQVLSVPPGHQATSIEVGVPPGVAGFVQEGDHISVIAYLDVPIEGSSVVVTDPETGQEELIRQLEPRAEYLIQDVEVLAVGRRVVTDPNAPEGQQAAPEAAILLTLAVTPEEAEQLTFAALDGELRLTLLPDDETTPVDTPGRSRDDIFED